MIKVIERECFMDLIRFDDGVESVHRSCLNMQLERVRALVSVISLEDANYYESF